MNNNNIAQITNQIKTHRAINHPFFSYLRSNSRLGFTAKQFQIYRDNYFFRTFHTIPCVAYLVAAAALNQDTATLATAGKNLYEETGCNDPNNVHSKLLEFSHNTHANIIFGLEAENLINITNSKLIVTEAREFVEKELSLYKSADYGIVLGAAYAHEAAANIMLINFYEAFFVKYRNHYTDNEYYSLCGYFFMHISGLEDNHAETAMLAATRWCTDQNSYKAVLEGAMGFLDSQARLWDRLHIEFLTAEIDSTIISFN